MKYEVTLKMMLKSSCDAERVARQIQGLFAVGTVYESFAEGLRLGEDPRLVDVRVGRPTRRRTQKQ